MHLDLTIDLHINADDKSLAIIEKICKLADEKGGISLPPLEVQNFGPGSQGYPHMSTAGIGTERMTRPTEAEWTKEYQGRTGEGNVCEGLEGQEVEDSAEDVEQVPPSEIIPGWAEVPGTNLDICDNGEHVSIKYNGIRRGKHSWGTIRNLAGCSKSKRRELIKDIVGAGKNENSRACATALSQTVKAYADGILYPAKEA